MNKIIIFSFLLLNFFGNLSSSLAATEPSKYTIPRSMSAQEQSSILKKAESYLNSLTTIVTDFTQVAPNGEISNGKFFLSRPGKLRIQYNPPVPIVITINKFLLAYYDYELDQLSHSTANDSIASFLTRPTISFFSSDILVEMVEKANNLIRIGVVKNNKKKDGKLVLMFTEYPFELRKIAITDAEGNTTMVTLSNAKLGTKIDDKLFVLTKKGPHR